MLTSKKLKQRFPRAKIPDFPPKHVSLWKLSAEDVKTRKIRLQKFLQELVDIPTLANSWEVQFFLEIKKNV